MIEIEKLSMFLIYMFIYLNYIQCQSVVQLNHGGSVEGVQELLDSNDPSTSYLKFLGIPYAQPPINELRFAPPKKHPGWTGKIRTTQNPPTCWQYIFQGFDAVNKAGSMWINNTEMSEDCLYLNVWRPSDSPGPRNLYPVMVWIYGGGFTSGSSTLEVYNGAILAVTQKVIVVSMQYRLGAFGFLRLDPNLGYNLGFSDSKTSNIALGNQGLLDQNLALQWVQENIKRFDGDPKQVTIFGESAGAVSVSLLWMSKIAQPNFQRAIIQSGAFLTRWGFDPPSEVHKKAVEFALGCNCESPSVNRVSSLKCLQSLQPQVLVDQLESVFAANDKQRFDKINKILGNSKLIKSNLPGLATSTRLYLDVPFKPTVDGYFLTENPTKMFETDDANKFKTKPELLIGVNKNEAMFFLLPGLSINNTQFLFNDGTVRLPEQLDFMRRSQEIKKPDFYWITVDQILDEKYFHQGVAKLPAYHYNLPFKTENSIEFSNPSKIKATSVEIITRLDDLTGDVDFVCPTIQFADLVATLPDSKVYLYLFNKRTKSLPLPEWTGVMHGYEIEYVFGMPRNEKFSNLFYGFTNDERETSDKVMKMWSNFAKTGNPSEDKLGHKINPQWPIYKPTNTKESVEFDYLRIEDDLKLDKSLRKDKCKFWLQEMEDLSRILKDTCSLANSVKFTFLFTLILLFVQYCLNQIL